MDTLNAFLLVGMGFEGGLQQFLGALHIAQTVQRLGFVEDGVQRPIVKAQRTVAILFDFVQEAQVDFGQRPVGEQHAAVFAYVDGLWL